MRSVNFELQISEKTCTLYTGKYGKRKNIKPLDGPLKKGQRVNILFDQWWSDGEVCEAWPKEKQSLGGNFLT